MEQEHQHRARRAMRTTNLGPQTKRARKVGSGIGSEGLKKTLEPHERRRKRWSEEDAARVEERRRRGQDQRWIALKNPTISTDATGSHKDQMKALLKRVLEPSSSVQAPPEPSNISGVVGYSRQEDREPVELLRNLRINSDYTSPRPVQKTTNQARRSREAEFFPGSSFRDSGYGNGSPRNLGRDRYGQYLSPRRDRRTLRTTADDDYPNGGPAASRSPPPGTPVTPMTPRRNADIFGGKKERSEYHAGAEWQFPYPEWEQDAFEAGMRAEQRRQKRR